MRASASCASARSVTVTKRQKSCRHRSKQSPSCGRISPRRGFRFRREDAAAIPRSARSHCSDNWEPRIGAFVCTNLPAARAAADRSTERWRAGKPLSPIDGMPVGIKDIIETVDMPTEMGSPLFAGWRSEKDAASVRALRDAGAVILGKTVTTEFAASEPRGTRNPWNTAHTPGGSSSGSAASVARRHRQRRARHPGDRLDHPAGELLRLRRLQAERQRAQSRRQSRLSEPELHRHSRRFARRRLAGRARDRRPRRRRCRHARPARAGRAAAGAQAAPPRRARNRRLGRARRPPPSSSSAKPSWRG